MSWDQFYNNVKHTVGKAATRLEQSADLASLQIQLTSAERKMQNAYTLLGRIYYRHAIKPSEETEEELAKALKAVALARRDVREMREIVKPQKSESESLPASTNDPLQKEQD